MCWVMCTENRISESHAIGETSDTTSVSHPAANDVAAHREMPRPDPARRQRRSSPAAYSTAVAASGTTTSGVNSHSPTAVAASPCADTSVGSSIRPRTTVAATALKGFSKSTPCPALEPVKNSYICRV